MATRDESATLLRPEAEVVFRAAGGGANDARLRTLIDGGLDWPRVVELAQAERGLPIVWARLAALGGRAAAPTELAASLDRITMVQSFRALADKDRGDAALDALAEAGIETVLLKGAALGYAAYASFDQRPMGDVDVLVAPADADRAYETLVARGWARVPVATEESVYDEHHHLPPLYDPATKLVIELHTRLFPADRPFPLTGDDIRRASRLVSAQGRVVRVPSVTHLVLHACLHFAWSHQMSSAAWRTFRDLEALQSAGGLDWADVIAESERVRGATCCYWALRLWRAVAGGDVPDEVLSRLAPPRGEAALARLERHFVLGLPAETDVSSVRLNHAAWDAAVLPEASGHGAVRPWDADDDFVPAPVPGVDAAPPTAWEKVRRHASSVSAWMRYSRLVLGGRRPG